MNPSPEHVMSLVVRAAVTLLLTASAAYVGWWMLRQLIAPALIVLLLIGVYRLVFRGLHHGRF